MLEKPSEDSSMRDLIVSVAGPMRDFDTRESWLASAARQSGLTFRTVKSAFYGEPVAERAKQRLKQLARQKQIEAGCTEARSLADRFETIAGGMNARDQDFHSADAAALLHAARILRGMDGA